MLQINEKWDENVPNCIISIKNEMINQVIAFIKNDDSFSERKKEVKITNAKVWKNDGALPIMTLLQPVNGSNNHSWIVLINGYRGGLNSK